MTNKQRGTRAEWELMDILKRHKYTVSRSGSSFSPFDLTAVNEDFCVHIQVKRVQGTYINFKREVEILEKVKIPEHCEKWLFVRLDKRGDINNKWRVQHIGGDEGLSPIQTFFESGAL